MQPCNYFQVEHPRAWLPNIWVNLWFSKMFCQTLKIPGSSMTHTVLFIMNSFPPKRKASQLHSRLRGQCLITQVWRTSLVSDHLNHSAACPMGIQTTVLTYTGETFPETGWITNLLVCINFIFTLNVSFSLQE